MNDGGTRGEPKTDGQNKQTKGVKGGKGRLLSKQANGFPTGLFSTAMDSRKRGIEKGQRGRDFFILLRAVFFGR